MTPLTALATLIPQGESQTHALKKSTAEKERSGCVMMTFVLPAEPSDSDVAGKTSEKILARVRQDPNGTIAELSEQIWTLPSPLKATYKSCWTRDSSNTSTLPIMSTGR